MKIFAEIVKAAVIGTERQQLTLTASGDDHGGPRDFIARLDQVNRANQTDREGALLGAAAFASLYERAGRLPQRGGRGGQSLPDQCPEDERMRCSPLSASHLSLMLQGDLKTALPEWLELLPTAGKRVPEEFIEPLLVLGRTRSELHSLIRGALDRRGLWLAAQNPEWDYIFEPTDEAVWETGEQEKRAALFGRMRRTDPARARELLKTTWSQEPSKNRADFLQRFGQGLSGDDEAFLESALDDRHKDVRRLAAKWLSSLPGTQLQQRMIARSSPLLTFKRGRMWQDRFEVEWPDVCDKPMIRDGIDVQPPPWAPPTVMGLKAWWLCGMLSAVDPRHWSRTFDRTPAELIAAAVKSESAEPLLVGWCQAAVRHADKDWAMALINWCFVDARSHERQARIYETAHAVINLLIAARSAPEIEEIAMRILSSDKSPIHDAHPVFMVLRAGEHGWSEKLSKAVIASLRQRIQKGMQRDVSVWNVHSWLGEVGLRVPAKMAGELEQGWPREADSWSYWEKAVEAMISLISFRNEMWRELVSS